MEIISKMDFSLILNKEILNSIGLSRHRSASLICLSLGATRHMILKPHEETLLAILSKNKGTNQLCLHTFENVVYDISRPKLLIKNFLLLR